MATSRPYGSIDEEQLVLIEGDFARDGAVCVRGALGRDHLALARHAVSAAVANPSALALRASRPDDGEFLEDFCRWQSIPEMEQLVRESAGAEIAGRLMRSRTVRLYHDHVLVKEAGTRQTTPWHQDLPYYNVAGDQNVSMWIPVDPVPRASTLEVVAGSHRGPWYLPRSFLDGTARWFPEGTLTDPPDFDAHPDRFPILGWELEPGDAVFFHMRSVHRAGGVDQLRRVITIRFLGDDMVHAPRAWTTSPPFEGLDDEMPAGEPMDHPLFPVVWSE